MPPIFCFGYLVGTWLLDMPTLAFEYELSFEWFREKLYEIGLPLFLGSFVCGVVLATVVFFSINALYETKRH